MATRPEAGTQRTAPIQVPPIEDAMDLDAPMSLAPVVKRTIGQVEGAPESERPKKKSKFEVWLESPLLKARPQLKPKIDPYGIVRIEIEGAGEGFVFQVPKLALINASETARKMFSHAMKETSSGALRWVGPEGMPDLHPQAAAQCVQAILLEYNLLDAGKRRTLEQLKEKFPEEFGVILSDVARMIPFYQIGSLGREVHEFLIQEFTADLEGNFPIYFQWALRAQTPAFQNAVSFFLFENVQVYVPFCELLIDLASADYSQCSEEEKGIALKLIRSCFLHVAKAAFNEEDNVDAEIEAVSDCFVALFPQCDIPVDFINRMTCIPEGVGATDFYVYHLCVCYIHLLAKFEGLSKYVFPRSLTLEEFADRPAATGKLKEYELLIEAMLFPTEARELMLNTFLEKFPKNMMAMQLRAWARFDRGDYAAAIQDINLALSMYPEEDSLWRNQAACHRKLGDLKKADEGVTQAIRLMPDHMLNWMAGAELHMQRGDPIAALEMLDHAHGIDDEGEGVPDSEIERRVKKISKNIKLET